MTDISKQVLETGKVCYNANNYTKCVVLDGEKGDENDRCSRVLELAADGTLFIHTPPNRALIPTGEFFDVSLIKNVLDMSEGQRNWVKCINKVRSQHSAKDCEYCGQNCIYGGDCPSLMSDEEKLLHRIEEESDYYEREYYESEYELNGDEEKNE